MDEICVGAGIDNLFSVIVRMIVSPGVPVVTSLGAYPTFNYQVNGNGGLLKTVPFHRDKEDPGRSAGGGAQRGGAAAVHFQPRTIRWVPGHDAGTIQRMIDAVPTGRLLVLDEAYIEVCTGRNRTADRHRQSPGDPDTHLLEGARHGGHADWIRHWPP